MTEDQILAAVYAAAFVRSLEECRRATTDRVARRRMAHGEATEVVIECMRAREEARDEQQGDPEPTRCKRP